MIPLEKTRPVWIEVNLDHLAHNMKEVRKAVKTGVLVTAVIKADGYGHGAVEIADTLLKNGADRLAVATLSEAVELRRVYEEVPILVMGYTPESCAEEVVINNIIQTVYSFEQAESFSKAAQLYEKEAVLHIKVDTGMSRLGFQPDITAVETIKKISELPNIKIEGIFTHFAVADEKDKSFTNQQYAKFMELVERLNGNGVRIPIQHCSNSAAIIDLQDYHLDMVRAGIMLYGLYPSDEVNKEAVKLKQVMALKAKISHLKELGPGIGVSYGLKHVTAGYSKIATLPIGYADGFTRMLSGKAEVLVKGNRVPVVGRICMDQCMIDVTGIDGLHRGDVVTLIGREGEQEISVDEVAGKLGTINYEVVCMMGKRIPRVYIRNGEIIKIKDYLLE